LGTGKKDAKDKTHALAALTGKKMVETLGRERNALDEFSLSAAFGYFWVNFVSLCYFLAVLFTVIVLLFRWWYFCISLRFQYLMDRILNS